MRPSAASRCKSRTWSGGPAIRCAISTLAAGYHSVLIVPLVGPDRIFGAIVLQRRAPGEFPEASVRLMQTIASQSALAIQNARLFREIAEKSEQLAEASRHKSQFLANMSHELRTPAERDPRLCRAAGRRHLRRVGAARFRRAGAGAEQRQAPAGADQRRARFVEDRGRAAGLHAGGLFAGRGRAVGGQRDRGHGAQQGARR